MYHVDPNSKFGKGLMILGLPIVTVLLWFELRGLFRSYRSLNWPVSAGLISDSQVEKERVHGVIPYSTAKIRYQYNVAGQQFENDTIAFGISRGLMTWGYADRKVAKFPKGKLVGVVYDPKDPEISCLEAGGLGWEDILMLLLAISSICVSMMQLAEFLRWFLRPRNPPLVN
jgi:hypothetical protein